MPRRTFAGLLVAALVALFCTTAVALPADAATARTTTIKASSTVPTAKNNVTFSGTLTHSPKGSAIKLQHKVGSSWATIKTVTTTTSAGAWTALIAMPATAGTYSYRASAAAKGSLKAATSATVKETVRPITVLTLTASPSTIVAGSSTTLSGTAKAFTKGKSVTVQYQDGAAWKALPGVTPTLSSTGTFSATVSPTSTTSYRVYSPAYTGHGNGYSPATVVSVTQPAQVITTTNLADGTVGAPYSDTVHAPSGSFAVTSGALPAGLSLSTSTGVISGTPTAAGTSAFTITWTGATSTDDQALSIHVDLAATVPAPVLPVVSAGGQHTCRIASGGTLSCWGYNFRGELGQGKDGLTLTQSSTPLPVKGGGTWAAVSAGTQWSTCGVKTDLSLWCWGNDDSGLLGDGRSAGEADAPVNVGSGSHWASVSVGDYHACAVTTGGTLWCWGDPGFGAVGSFVSSATTPLQVGTDTDWKTVSAGGSSTCAVKTTGQLWCWGSNTQGQLGSGVAADGQSHLPTRVGTGTSWATVSDGSGSVCATTTSGTAWCWGKNTDGRVGDGTTTPRPGPVQVGTGQTWASISTAGSGNFAQTCGVTTAGQLWCWGSRLGTDDGSGSPVASLSPTRLGTASTWASVEAGGDHDCGVQTTGSTWCWGDNSNGQLGSGGASTPNPTQVS